MKKVFILFVLLISVSVQSIAFDRIPEELLSWMRLSPKSTSQDAATSILGKPLKIEESKKRTCWYYAHDNATMVVYWNNKSGSLEKFSFVSHVAEKTTFDTRLSGRLKSGTTDINQAVKLLGMPRTMTIKAVTQEMHYAYNNSVLRLFFRNRTLVDFTLQSQQ